MRFFFIFPLLSIWIFGASAVYAATVDAEASRFARSFFGALELDLAMDEAVPMRTRYLSDPYRVIFEFEGLDFADLPIDFGTDIRGVERVLFGNIAKGSRLVVTFEEPMRVASSSLSASAVDGRAGLHAEFEAADEAAFAELVDRLGYEADDVGFDGKIAGDASAAAPLIVIDPGHGGVDPGAVRGQVLEKTITLNAAKHIVNRVGATGRYRLALTRDRDVYVPLQLRRRIAESLGADLFLSIHADTVEIGDARGTTVYLLSEEASSEAAAQFARFENRVDLFAGSAIVEKENDINLVLLDLAQRASMERADRFARILQREWIDINRVARESRIGHAGFVVLKAPEVPSLLLEIGYMSNVMDRQKIQDPAWLDQLSLKLIAALDQFFAE